MSKFLLLSLICLASLQSNAKQESLLYKIAGKTVKFKPYDDVLVNIECKIKCIALSRLKSLKLVSVKVKPTKSSMSLGSYICKKELMGTSVLGIDKNKNMRDFCFFKEDKSLIQINSLTQYSQKLLIK